MAEVKIPGIPKITIREASPQEKDEFLSAIRAHLKKVSETIRTETENGLAVWTIIHEGDVWGVFRDGLLQGGVTSAAVESLPEFKEIVDYLSVSPTRH